MRQLRLFPVLLTLTLGCAAATQARRSEPPAAFPPHRRALVLSCDGGGAEFFDRMVAAGHMPNLARIRSRGLHAAYARTSFPSKTAPGHASIWTGAYGDRSGIVANHVPLLPFAEHCLEENDDGFSVERLQVEPVWVTAARQGKRTIIVQATHTTPITAYMPGGRFGDTADRIRIIDFYKGQIGSHAVYQGDLPKTPSDWPDAPAGSQSLMLPGEGGAGAMPALLADDPTDPAVGFDTIAIDPGRRWAGSVRLKTSAPDFSRAIPWPESSGRQAMFRLWELSADGRQMRLYRSAISQQVSNRPDNPAASLGAVAGGPEVAYTKGGFGPTLIEGGDGTAESRYVDAVGNCLDNHLSVARTLLTAEDWDLGCLYLPFPDAAEHMWTGLMDPRSPFYRPTAVPIMEGRLVDVCRKVDSFIGQLAAIRPDAAIAVTSDHGLEPVHWDFFPNVLLERAGLLVYGPDGKVDLSRTRIYYPDFDAAALYVNHVGRKGGIVPAAEIPHVLARAKKALGAAKDPRTGKPVVTATFDPDPAFGTAGPACGDLYLDLLSGYYFNPKGHTATWWGPRPPFFSGGHIFHPERPNMRATFAMAGPGVPQRALPPVRTVDVIPTVCDYLGIRPPSAAIGHSLLPPTAPIGQRPGDN